MKKKLDEKYLKTMKEMLKDDYEKYIKSFEEESYKGIRINTLKTNKEDFLKLVDKKFENVMWCETGLCYRGEFRIGKSIYYNAGLCYSQEPSAMSPVEILEIKKDDYVLDLCSAPGGKSTQIGIKLENTGLLVSNDISNTRSKLTSKNIELQGITNCTILSENQNKLSEYFVGFFDKVLVDAPCSGEGMFRKDKELIKNWSLEKVEQYENLQIDLLEKALKMVKVGGEIVYSTCTFNIKENENTIKKILQKDDIELVNIDIKKYGLNNGFGLNGVARILPYKNKGEGHFIAKLKKTKGEETDINSKPFKQKIEGIEYFHEFEKKYFTKPIKKEGYVFKSHGTSLFIIHKHLAQLSKIRVVRSGFYVGELKKKRFEPSQALALSIKSDDFNEIINLKKDDNNVIKYLRGDTLEIDHKNGWVLICVEKFPLGFGKSNNGKIKNKYDKKFIGNI